MQQTPTPQYKQIRVNIGSLCSGFPIYSLLMIKNNSQSFDILLTVHLNIFILILTNLMH